MGNTVAYAKELGAVAVPMRGVPLDLTGDGKIDAVAYDTTGDGCLDSLDLSLDGHADTMLPCGPGVIVSERRLATGGGSTTYAGPGDVVTVGVKGKLANGREVSAKGKFALDQAGDIVGILDERMGGSSRGKNATASLLGRQAKDLLPLGGAGLKCLERGICRGNGDLGPAAGLPQPGMRVGETARFSCTADILRAEGFQHYGYDASGLQKITGGFGTMELDVSLLDVSRQAA